MKKTVIIFMLAVFSFVAKGAVTTESHTISFSESDYTFSYDENGSLVIGAVDGDATYSSPNEPGLPLRSLSLAIPGTRKYESSSLSFSKRLIRSNVTLAPGPIPVTTDGTMEPVPARTVSYGNVTYPASNCLYTLSSEWSDLSMIHFLTTPFIYDAGARKLYFIDSIQLTVRTVERPSGETSVATFAPRAIVNSMVANKDAVSRIPAMRVASPESSSDADRIDYVVITSEELKPAFVPLVNWKRAKGLRSKIITVEEIDSKYEGESSQLRIKKCLYDLYQNNSLRFAMLGGDDTVVPVRKCFAQIRQWPNDSVIAKRIIPTDLYYACFGGSFKWDANDNGLYGELADNIDMAPSIYLTRVPVRTQQHVNSFINKLLGYEQKPKWHNNLLMSGVEMHKTFINKQSDAEAQGEILYEKYMKPYWGGDMFRFYDTCTDFPAGKDYDVSSVNLSDQLSKGYSFVDMMTHGGANSWKMEYEGDNYTSDIGNTQNNSAYTVITTVSCHTNAFDSTIDPCLSESLIRNPESGIIAYLGSSREGWGTKGRTLLYSSKYEAYFYKTLFSQEPHETNYGVIVAASKLAMAPQCNSDHPERWLQFGLNPIGDPEMPIFTTFPKNFDKSVVKELNGELKIDTGVDGCRVCIMSAWDNGESYYRVWDNISSLSVTDFPSNFSICVTKQNYVPYHYVRGYIQNETLNGYTEMVGGIVKVGSDVTPLKEKGQAVFSKGSLTNISADTIELEPGTMIKKGAKVSIINSQK